MMMKSSRRAAWALAHCLLAFPAMADGSWTDMFSYSGFAAARHLARGQSAVTYTIQKLEALVGNELFDRSKYRPALSNAGRALLPYARRIAEDVGAFSVQAHSIADGLETELTLAVDSMFPMPVLRSALKQFQNRFPTIQPRVYVESLGSTLKLVLDGICAAGLVISVVSDPDVFARTPLTEVELLMVAAPTHPLALLRGPLSPDALRDQVQLVLTDRSGLMGARDFSVHATRTWRLADLGAKHATLKAGIGFGSMPVHMIADDLKTRKLQRLVLGKAGGEAPMPVLPLCAITRLDQPVGPATRWMIEHLQETSRPTRARRKGELAWVRDRCRLGSASVARGAGFHQRKPSDRRRIMDGNVSRPARRLPQAARLPEGI